MSNTNENLSKETLESSGASTSIGDELKMDPNYSWVLKDLNFGRKRMIDVTELLNSKEVEHQHDEHFQILATLQQQQKTNNQKNHKITTTTNSTTTSNNNSSKNKNCISDAAAGGVGAAVARNKRNIHNNYNAKAYDNDENANNNNDFFDEENININNIINDMNNINGIHEQEKKRNLNLNAINNSNSNNSSNKNQDDDDENNMKSTLLDAASTYLFSDNSEDSSSNSNENENGELLDAHNNVNDDEEDNDNEADEDDDEKMLQEQLTNLLTYNPNYRSTDTTANYVQESIDNDQDDDDDDNDEILNDDKKFLKTSTFKILTPFAAELFPNSDEDEEDENSVNAFSNISEKDEEERDNGTYSVQQLCKHYENILHSDDEKKENKQRNGVMMKNPYSKSFDISLNELDARIDRINNEIKLKKKIENENCELDDRKTVKVTSEETLTNLTKDNNTSNENKNRERNENNVKDKSSGKEDASTSFSFYVTDTTQAQPNQQQMNAKILETLKSEVSQAFTKLELEYKLKMDEQQRLSEMKMKQMYEELRESIREKSEKATKSPAKDIDQYSISSSTLVNSNTIDDTSSSALKSAQNLPQEGESENEALKAADARNYMRSQSLKNDSQKQLSNLRLSLKTKHSRHIQDLKTYYEQEIDELRKELQKTQNKFNELSVMNSQSLGNLSAKKMDNNSATELQRQIEEMKNQNLALLQKIYESDQHMDSMRHENYELRSQLNKMNTEHFLKDENTKKLENTINQLQVELNEINKSQDIHIRDLQNEKRIHAKKCQEYEELKRVLKATEDKIDDLELKLNEKETENCSLKTKITKLEADLSRIDHEYQKMRSKFLASGSNILAQESDRTKRYSMTNMIAMNGNSPLYNTNNMTSPSVSSMKSTSNLKYPSIATYSASQSQLYDTSPNLLKKFDSHQELNSHSEFNVNDDTIPHYEAPSANVMSPSNTATFQPEKHLEYIAHLEEKFDQLMKRKQQLEAQLTRLPHKATNTSMHVIKQSLENDVTSVEKQLASVKLELRKLNIIKTSH